jgi:hypothetical protein
MNARTTLALVAGLAAASGAAAQTYSITALNPGLSGNSYGTGVNEAGDVCGQARVSTSSYVSTVWTNGQPVQGLNTQNGVASDLNNAGQATGGFYGAAGFIPYVWDNGTTTQLSPSPGRLYGDTWQINDSGVIAGTSYDGTTPNWVGDPCTWSRGGGQWVVSILPRLTPGGAGGAYGINSAGVLVGVAQDADGVYRACKWDGGVATELAAPAPSTYSFATSINNAGRYIGNVRNGSPLASTAFVSDGGSLTPIAGASGYASTHAHRINDAGTVVGWCFNGDPVNWAATLIDCTAIVWRHGTTSTLNSLVHSSPWPTYNIRQAWDINERGQIAAMVCINGTGANCTGGFFRAALLTPCYANCDNSLAAPILNVNDFVCFQGRFAAGDGYADCDHSGVLNVNDFVCFQAAFAAGCQ